MKVPAFYYPSHLNGGQLDAFLADGWYRMFQSIFTTNYIQEKDSTYRVFWIRYNLNKIQLQKTALKILSKNEHFTVTAEPLKLTTEMEELYRKYKEEVAFEASKTVQQWLYEEQTSGNVYDSYCIKVRDGRKLIAVGIYDKGQDSIAGILNFYDPQYKKFSLGKFLMLRKIHQAKTEGKSLYYPGYIVYGYPKFDYKLFADRGAIEIYLPEVKRWFLFDEFVLSDVV